LLVAALRAIPLVEEELVVEGELAVVAEVEAAGKPIPGHPPAITRSQ